MNFVENIKSEIDGCKNQPSNPYEDPNISIYKKHLLNASKDEVLLFMKEFGSSYRTSEECFLCIFEIDGPKKLNGNKEIVLASLYSEHWIDKARSVTYIKHLSPEIQDMFRQVHFHQVKVNLEKDIITEKMEKMQADLKPKPPSQKRGIKI